MSFYGDVIHTTALQYYVGCDVTSYYVIVLDVTYSNLATFLNLEFHTTPNNFCLEVYILKIVYYYVLIYSIFSEPNAYCY